ncbi:MAG TPA: 16S rRNA (cytidine(1402)-2'-O)-methyltransferase [Microscillaceae bacterium]|jgi:16S rRNA (cytidine1402-2'-O)-methyltransferase|nr:16S rRNA (cytidine(1402)-2'-O)-methyltransferase [Microscillaceae bacterium]
MDEKISLFLVPTPVGNLEDITLRAIKVLQQVDVILAEDTRKTGVLLKHLSINRPLQSYHIFNEHQTVERLIKAMAQGQQFALVSDAGTPCISDPGFLLVRACRQAGLVVQCLPGATAFVPALAQAGLPTDRFCFEGFLPPKKGRKTRLELLASENRTMIFYEAPHRIRKTLAEFVTFFGAARMACVVRELSKIYEETQTDTLDNLAAYFDQKEPKGEFVIIVEGKKGKANEG